MYPVINPNPTRNMTGDSFWDTFATLPGIIESHVPTLDKSLDAYFDQHFAAIIEEWDLVTESDLEKLESRLSRVSDEISSLYAGRAVIEARAKRLDDLITSMERSS
ncbi:MAG: hypothetical protein WCC86_01995 [Methanoregula sp.]|uniref:hypothetical protein n=1 Tax=Methanoregula sp. TaxID=2052170 RepID=UPI003BB1EC31